MCACSGGWGIQFVWAGAAGGHQNRPGPAEPTGEQSVEGELSGCENDNTLSVNEETVDGTIHSKYIC